MSLKRIGQKITAVFIMASMLYGDFALCGVGIGKVIAENLKAPELEIAFTNSAYVQYSSKSEEGTYELTDSEEKEVNQTVQEDYAGVAVQSNLKLISSKLDEGITPIGVQIEVNLPSINEEYPEKVILAKASTLLTSGETENKTLDQNYDQDSGLFVISYENVNDDLNSLNTEDEFEIIYIYPEESYTENNENVELSYSVNVNSTYKTENDLISSSSKKNESFTYEENVGDLSMLKLTGINENIYKGYMYSNEENGTNYNTNFETTSTLSILNHKVLDELELNFGENKFELNDEEASAISASDVVYNSVSIDKTEFDKLFGTEGSLEFYNDKTLLATVKYVEVDNENKASVIHSDGSIDFLNDASEITVKFEKPVTNYNVKTTKPLTEGLLNIVNNNSINPADNYGARVSRINYIDVTTASNGFETMKKIELLEPETKISVTSSEVNLSTLEPNKTTLTIKLNDTNSSVKLFDNPVIEIILPEVISGNLSSPEILNANGLSIKSASGKGNIVTIELEGKQTAYDLENMAGGVCIVMDVENLTFAKSTPTHTDSIVANCIENERKIASASCNVNINSKEDVLVLSQIGNFNDNQDVIELKENETVNATLESYGGRFNSNQNVVVVNNTESTLENFKLVTLLNYTLDEKQSTFIMNISEELKMNNIDATVQYVDINQNITDELNENTIGYIVTFEDGLKAKTALTIDSKILIPEQLGEDQQNFIINQVTYIVDGNQYVKTYNTKMSTKESLKVREESVNNIELPAPQEGQVSIELAEIKVGDKYITEDTDLMQGQTVKYKYKITNNTDQDLGNIKIRTTLENEKYYEIVDSGQVFNENGDTAHYYQEVERENGVEETNIGILKANSSIECEYQVVVNSDAKNVVNKIELVNVSNESITEHTINNNVKESLLKLNLQSANNEEKLITAGIGETYNMVLNVENISNKKLNNIKINIYLPEEFKLNSYIDLEDINRTDNYMEYDYSRHMITCSIEKLEKGEKLCMLVIIDVGDIDANLLSKDIKIIADSKINGSSIISNDLERTINQAKSFVTIKSNSNLTDKLVENGDVINYELDITNFGKLNANNSNLYVKFDRGLEIENSTLISKDGKKNIEINKNNVINEIITLNSDSNYKLLLRIKVNEDLVENKNNTKLKGIVTVDNKYGSVEKLEEELEIKYTTEEEKQLEKMKYEIEKLEKAEQQHINNQQQTEKSDSEVKLKEGTSKEKIEKLKINQQNKTYSISGTAWLDANKNGFRDGEELLLPYIMVSLVDKSTGDFVKNLDGTIYEVSTDYNGKYSFYGLPKGTYIVVFEFDTNQYTTTTYKKDNVNESLNSDAIITDALIYGENKKIAITDSIYIAANKNNIDIGLEKLEEIHGQETIAKTSSSAEANSRNNANQSETGSYIVAIVVAVAIIGFGSYIIKKKIIDE